MPPYDAEDTHDGYAHLPIPTYEEATSSRPSSTNNLLNEEAERRGLLYDANTALRGQGRYRPPTAASPRSSEDSDLQLPEVDGDDRDNDRRRIEELDYMEPGDDQGGRNTNLYHHARIRSKLSQRWTNFSATLSNLRLPRLRGFYSPINNDADNVPPPSPTPAAASTDPWLARAWSKIPERYRLSGPTAARLCGLFTIGIVVYMLFAFDVFPNRIHNMGSRFDPESVRSYVQEHISSSGDAIEAWLHHITSFDHVAGTKGDFVMAEWMKEIWAAEGAFDELALMEYFVYLNYPSAEDGSRSWVSLQPGNNMDSPLRWSAQVQEGQVSDDKEQPLVWHGHSKGGEARGHLIYANGGNREDFDWLKNNGVQTQGSIALVRYYATQADRGLKIKAAEEAGCSGVLMYSDPSDDGVGKGPVWPDGPWRPADSVQRGGVGLTSWIIGDPLTPGYASTQDADCQEMDNNPGLPNIPSIPLAWNDAKVLLQNLTMNKGYGVKVPKSWRGGDADFDKKRHWYSGAAVTGEEDMETPVVSMSNNLEFNQKQPIWNLHGLIRGMETPGQKVMVGNHRDSWCFGAVDPGSGSAVLMELVSIFSELTRLGWRPLRTIEFVSWDATEFNLMGSTEYVEDNLDHLRDAGVAYINVDAGVFGPNFHATGSPLLQRPLLQVLDRVSDPGSNDTKTLRQLWNSRGNPLGGIGARGDSVPFQDMAGIASIDFGFAGDDHAFPYHSCYETIDWMLRYGDSGGLPYHRALAQVWALLILEIADRPLLPFDLRDYAREIKRYVETLSHLAQDRYKRLSNRAHIGEKDLERATSFTVASLRDAANMLAEHANDFHTFEEEWISNVMGRGGFETSYYAQRRLDFNSLLATFDSRLLDIPANDNVKGDDSKERAEHDQSHGIPGREQFKHIIFAPSTNKGHEVSLFPAVMDAIELGDWEGARVMVDKVTSIIERAARQLVN